ncbi:MAG: serine hydrolase [Pseudomonadales bacterium]|jgi:D-alanyl-D-alanine endopeptidase (penicillin-binding protein 7)|nr:serine hydrolase [Pseudomonadales bacterium]
MPVSPLIVRRSVAFCLLCLAALAATAAAREAPDAVRLASVHAAVARLDAAPDEFVLARRADRSVPIASVTKLMTALVVLESGADLDAWLEIRDWDPRPPNNPFSHMRPGSELKRRDLLRIMLQASENLAAHTLARHHAGGFEAFVAAMNETAAALGMSGSSFVEPSGLSPGNRSTAADLVRLARRLHAEPLVREYSTSRYFEARFREPRYTLTYGNTNRLVASSRWDVALSKTGYLSEAGRCLVMVTTLEDVPHVVVLLDSFGSRSPLGDAGRIRRWLATGETGRVAPAAADYVQRRVEAMEEEDVSRAVQ